MSVIVNLRGPGGSGKTSAVRGFMRNAYTVSDPIKSIEPRHGKSGRLLAPRILGYGVGLNTLYGDQLARVVGSYENTCGGCDNIKEQDEIRSIVRQWANDEYHVVFEGLLVSSVWGAWEAFAKEMEELGHTYVWAFMNTPYDQCLENIYKRNGGRKIKEELVKNKWDTNQSQIRRTSNDDYVQMVINNWRKGGEAIKAALELGLGVASG